MLYKKYIQVLQGKFVAWFNNYFGNLSLRNAKAEAKKIFEHTGKKMFVIMLKGEFVAISKQEFKALWRANPKMKHKTIQEWQYSIYEHNQTS